MNCTEEKKKEKAFQWSKLNSIETVFKNSQIHGGKIFFFILHWIDVIQLKICTQIIAIESLINYSRFNAIKYGNLLKLIVKHKLNILVCIVSKTRVLLYVTVCCFCATKLITACRTLYTSSNSNGGAFVKINLSAQFFFVCLNDWFFVCVNVSSLFWNWKFNWKI